MWQRKPVAEGETRDAGRWSKGDERYKACFRTPPCAACKREGPNEAAHGEDGGMRMKVSDKSCIPLCTRAAASDRARATAFSHNMRSALVLPRTIAPRTPCTRIPSARILILFDGIGPCRAGPVNFTYPGALYPGTPLCKSAIAGRNSCGPSSKSETILALGRNMDGAPPR